MSTKGSRLGRAVLISTVPLLALGTAWGAADIQAPQMTVELPPLVVTAKRWPWRYAAVGDMEMISQSPDSTIKRFAETFQREMALLRRVLPEEFQAALSARKTFVLSSEEAAPVLSRQALANEPSAKVKYLPNLRLDDRDSMSTFALISNSGMDWSKLHLSPGYVRFLLERRTPALPAWAISGFMDIFATMEFMDDAIRLNQLTWISHKETQKIVERAARIKKEQGDASMPLLDSVTEMLPLKTLLEQRQPSGAEEASAGDLTLWQPESAFFVRWALDSTYNTPGMPANPKVRGTARQDSFWAYVARVAKGPATEAVFSDCFGMDYEEMELRLNDYVGRTAGSGPFYVVHPQAQIPKPVELTIRPATGAEFARIKGDWDRLEMVDVTASHPEFAPNYVEQARATLEGAVEEGLQDEAALAILGLYYVDLKRDADARPFLENAVAARVVRPRVYYELARIRYADAQRHPEAPGGQLSGEQVASVIGPLEASRNLAPALLESHQLAAEVFLRSSVAPTTGQRELLMAGLDEFPRKLNLIFATSVLLAGHGFPAEAARAAEKGRLMSSDASDKARFEKVLSAIPNKSQK